jgi:hypothetical protein
MLALLTPQSSLVTLVAALAIVGVGFGLFSALSGALQAAMRLSYFIAGAMCIPAIFSRSRGELCTQLARSCCSS